MLTLTVPLVREGRIEGVYLALLATTALAGFEAVRHLGEALQSLGCSVAVGEHLFEVSDSRPAVADPEEALAAPAGRVLEFDGVAFVGR